MSECAASSLALAVLWPAAALAARPSCSEFLCVPLSSIPALLCHDECSIARLSSVLQEERVSTTLVGMATRDMVRQNVATVSKALSKPLENGQLATLDAIEHLFTDVRNLSWESGKPENN